MAMTSGSFSPRSQPAVPDLTKDAESFTVLFAAGAATTQVVNPDARHQSVTVFNDSNNYVRGTITYVLGTVTSFVADQTFVVAPNGVVSIDFADNENDDAVGALNVIESISFLAIDIPNGVAKASAANAAVAARAGVLVANFASS